MINGLFSQINAFRAQNGVPALQMDSLGMKDAEIRATQFAAYMATNKPGQPGFNPHQGYDTTAASLGYNLISENLAYLATDPAYIVAVAWNDTLHIAAMLATEANIAGVSCIYANAGVPYWSYEPGCSPNFCGQNLPVAPPPPTPQPPSSPSGPTGGVPTVDSEEWNFLTLINNYRAQNGAGPLQVSIALENSSQWMSNDMATKNYASHTDSLGRDAGTRLAAFGYPYSPWGENIAGGFSDAQTALNQWAAACDPDASGNCTYAHRKNMLNPAFVVIGIARAFNANSTYGWYWTTDFGGFLDATMSQNSPPAPTSAPAISSFTATPAQITAGQSSTLNWSVSGATSISISGVGTVSGSSISVSPSQTTVYTLTAGNSTGNSSAQLTVSVNPALVTQLPSTPTLAAIAKSTTEVDLTWTASTDNVGVAGYQITRNGTVLASVSGTSLSYPDTSVTAHTTYSYMVKAYDAAHNYSNGSNTVVVTTPAPSAATTPTTPPPSTCPGPATNVFTGCYYNNLTLSGNPVLVRTDSQIAFDWYYTSPASAVTVNNFSVLWQGNFVFAQGDYTFTAITSDGMRVYIDGNLVLDRWLDRTPYEYVFRQTLTQGTHLLMVQYYEHTGTPTAHLTWQSDSRGATAPVISSFSATPAQITAGQSSTLSWSVAGATNLSVNNGVGTVSGSSASVSPAQTTVYTLTASNSSGTTSAQVTVTVKAAQVTQPPGTPTQVSGSSTCPGPATNAFMGCYYNNLTLSGNPALVRTDPQIAFDWYYTSPAPSVAANNFSVLWQGNFVFSQGDYTFTAITSDGMRVYIDGNLVLDRWLDRTPYEYVFRQTLTQGTHLLVVKYYEHTGTPTAHLTWANGR